MALSTSVKDVPDNVTSQAISLFALVARNSTPLYAAAALTGRAVAATGNVLMSNGPEQVKTLGLLSVSAYTLGEKVSNTKMVLVLASTVIVVMRIEGDEGFCRALRSISQ